MKLNIVKYFIFSCLATGVDFSISYFLYIKVDLNYLISSNIGIFSGLILHYYTSMKYVFKNDSFNNSLFIYITTFLLGLALANITIWISYDLACLSFLFSKILSVAIPFFITYFIRKRLLGLQTNAIKEVSNEDLL